MNKITEIIPDDFPEWAQEAFDGGQFFRVAVDRVNRFEIEIALYRSESRYQYREIGKNEWRGCTKDYMSYCDESAEFDTRTIGEKTLCPKHDTGGGPCYCDQQER